MTPTMETLLADLSEFKDTQTDVLVIGSGLAGMSVALSLPSNLTVTVLSKDCAQEGSSYYAQGGIAGMLADDDSIKHHVRDTLVAGDGLCHPEHTQSILQEGAVAVNWLTQLGVPFTKAKEADSQSIDCLHLTREGGHSHRRIAHADDATGKHIMDTLLRIAHNRANIQLLAEHEAVELLTNNREKNKPRQPVDFQDSKDQAPQCQGAIVLNTANNRLTCINAKAVVLATGGLGKIFQRATAPEVCIGDGIMMAWQAGCRLANLEFVQFHPTGLAMNTKQNKPSSFLISEAVRGEGGRLHCPITGKRFMLEIDERAELAPRDIVARAIHQQAESNGLGYVHLDISHQSAEFIKHHFPQIYQYCIKLELDITKQPIPIAPTAHYSCGGVLTSVDGLTDVLGLYAVGEVAYTGLHGANRLASNSLLECVVVGHKIAHHLTQANHSKQPLDQSLQQSWQRPYPADTSNALYIDFFANNPLENNRSKQKFNSTISESAECSTQARSSIVKNNNYHSNVKQLQQLMSEKMGIVRHRDRLENALEQLQQWKQGVEQLAPIQMQTDETLSCNESPNDILPDDTSSSNESIETTVNRIRWHRLLTLAQLMLSSALARQESRGGHARSDYLDKASKAKVSIVKACSV